MRPIRSAVLTVACIAALVGAAFAIAPPGREVAGLLPSGSPPLPDQRVVVGGKVWTKTAREHVKLSAKDLELAHDGVTRHATGRAIRPLLTTTNGYDPSYTSPHDWWMEAEVYLLHRQEYVGNPPVQMDYYRGGYDLWGWRGMGAYDEVWGDTETPALLDGDIYFAVVEHPIGDTLTINRSGPWRTYHTTNGNYHCNQLSAEFYRAVDPTVVLRTNLVVRPVFKYWDSDTATFRAIATGQTRRMAQSRELVADGTDQQYPAAYSDHWSEFVGIPGNVKNNGPGPCAPEVIQEP